MLVVLGLQATMSLHLSNTASPSEALCLNAGHAELARLLHGSQALPGSASCGGGSAETYPLLASVADLAGGLAAARAMSLAAMLAATSLLYSLTRLMFNERVGLLAAALFSAAGSTIVTGELADADALALALLALAAWITVRTASHHWPGYLIAAPVAVLAAATSYRSILLVPALAALTALAALPHHGRRSLIAPVAFAAMTAAVAALLALADPAFPHAVWSTVSANPQGSTRALAGGLMAWEGPLVGLSLFGGVVYAVRAQNEPGELIAPAGSRSRRLVLGIVLTGTAILTPMAAWPGAGPQVAEQVSYALLFAAPMAGAGLARIIGDHFRRAQIGVALWGATLAFGLVQSTQAFSDWPSARPLVAAVTPYLRPGARYLVESPETLIYYLRDNPDAQIAQFSSILKPPPARIDGASSGDASYEEAVQTGRFRLIAYDNSVAPDVDRVLARTLAADPRYRLASVVPMRTPDGSITYYIWIEVQ